MQISNSSQIPISPHKTVFTPNNERISLQDEQAILKMDELLFARAFDFAYPKYRGYFGGHFGFNPLEGRIKIYALIHTKDRAILHAHSYRSSCFSKREGNATEKTLKHVVFIQNEIETFRREFKKVLKENNENNIINFMKPFIQDGSLGRIVEKDGRVFHFKKIILKDIFQSDCVSALKYILNDAKLTPSNPFLVHKYLFLSILDIPLDYFKSDLEKINSDDAYAYEENFVNADLNKIYESKKIYTFLFKENFISQELSSLIYTRSFAKPHFGLMQLQFELGLVKNNLNVVINYSTKDFAKNWPVEIRNEYKKICNELFIAHSPNNAIA